jgi:hypothetical protein
MGHRQAEELRLGGAPATADAPPLGVTSVYVDGTSSAPV